jgi:hypothetical protein
MEAQNDPRGDIDIQLNLVIRHGQAPSLLKFEPLMVTKQSEKSIIETRIK